MAAVSLGHERIATHAGLSAGILVHLHSRHRGDGRCRFTGRGQLPGAFLIRQQPLLGQSALVRIGGEREATELVGHELIGGRFLDLAAVKEEQFLEIQTADLAAKGIHEGQETFLTVEKHGSGYPGLGQAAISPF